MRLVQSTLNWLRRPATLGFMLIVLVVSCFFGAILGSYIAPAIWGP